MSIVSIYSTLDSLDGICLLTGIIKSHPFFLYIFQAQDSL